MVEIAAMTSSPYSLLPSCLHKAGKLLKKHKPSASIFVNIPGEAEGVCQIRQYGVVHRYKATPLEAARQFVAFADTGEALGTAKGGGVATLPAKTSKRRS